MSADFAIKDAASAGEPPIRMTACFVPQNALYVEAWIILAHALHDTRALLRNGMPLSSCLWGVLGEAAKESVSRLES